MSSSQIQAKAMLVKELSASWVSLAKYIPAKQMSSTALSL
jgi:hypothetical protein